MTSGVSDPVHLVFGVDQAYAPFLGVTLASVAATGTGDIRAHIIHDGVDAATQARVRACAPGIAQHWYELRDHPLLAFEGRLHFSRACYFRLAMPELLPRDIDRAIYLDVDILVRRDLRELWDTDLGGHALGAVADPGVDSAAFAGKWGLADGGVYANSGVLLIDLAQVRRDRVFVRAAELLRTEAERLEVPDQDALNVVCWRAIQPLDPSWNFQRVHLRGDLSAWPASRPGRPEPALIHYTENIKPWMRLEKHPAAWPWLAMLFRTPFRREVLRAGRVSPRRLLKAWWRWTRKRPAFMRGG